MGPGKDLLQWLVRPWPGEGGDGGSNSQHRIKRLSVLEKQEQVHPERRLGQAPDRAGDLRDVRPAGGAQDPHAAGVGDRRYQLR